MKYANPRNERATMGFRIDIIKVMLNKYFNGPTDLRKHGLYGPDNRDFHVFGILVVPTRSVRVGTLMEMVGIPCTVPRIECIPFPNYPQPAIS